MPIKKILVPTDGSVFSHRAAKLGIDIKKAANALVTLFHVIEVKAPQLLEAANIEKVKAKQAEICFKDFEEESKSAGIKFETKMLISRNTPQAIIDEIEVQSPDIVIMGSRGLTGLKKLVLGSVTTEVLKKSIAPVLVVK
jgi:nucleotide-binding universal stress UspA family protein